MGLSVDEVLAHAGVYDATARRQRYLRDRQLKGRQPGQAPDLGGNQGGNGSTPAPAFHTMVNQAQSTSRQVAALQARLSSLKAALQKLLADASSSSSSKSSSSSSTKSGGSSANNQPKTAKQKDAAKVALKKAQAVRAKTAANKPKTTVPTKEEKIAHLRATIQDVESKLRAALDKARNQTASNGR